MTFEEYYKLVAIQAIIKAHLQPVVEEYPYAAPHHDAVLDRTISLIKATSMLYDIHIPESGIAPPGYDAVGDLIFRKTIMFQFYRSLSVFYINMGMRSADRYFYLNVYEFSPHSSDPVAKWGVFDELS